MSIKGIGIARTMMKRAIKVVGFGLMVTGFTEAQELEKTEGGVTIGCDRI